MSSLQRDYAVSKLKIDERKVILLRWPVDQIFWRPILADQNTVCAVGREMRDYATLTAAMRTLPHIPCHIAAGSFAGKRDAWITALQEAGPMPPNITVGPLNYPDLRALYARSRFVVIPILPTDTDNGTTSILEAMAMGRAVICSRVNGQRDVLQEGTTGLYVPPQNQEALREAVEYLWNNPKIANEMGRKGRAWIEQHHTLDFWVERVRTVVAETIDTKTLQLKTHR